MSLQVRKLSEKFASSSLDAPSMCVRRSAISCWVHFLHGILVKCNQYGKGCIARELLVHNNPVWRFMYTNHGSQNTNRYFTFSNKHLAVSTAGYTISRVWHFYWIHTPQTWNYEWNTRNNYLTKSVTTQRVTIDYTGYIFSGFHS